ncbi:hypothetical protein NKDENANG_03149 [Candidatus Entotheonellaceae bacterium PAL068K]
MFWYLDTHWHLRRSPAPHELSLQDTVKGLQTLLLADQGALLSQTLRQVFGRPLAWSELSRLDIRLFQEGADQRVWRVQARLANGASGLFGLITARAPGASSTLTQHDFRNLQVLHARQHRYCVRPYTGGTMPVGQGVAAYAVEWLDHHKELVFEITRDGGVFLVNAQQAQRTFSPRASRRIWRRLMEILWWYTGLQRINIQAGDFVGYEPEPDRFDLRLTTARALTSTPAPTEHLQVTLRSVITASGYLSDGRQPFDRQMPKERFLHRMQTVLQRRFGYHATRLAGQQWLLFQQGAFARQEDWLKEDGILATYDYLRATCAVAPAWQETRRRWLTYANAVQAGQVAPSWWFPAAEIPVLLDRLTDQFIPGTAQRLETQPRTRPA